VTHCKDCTENLKHIFRERKLRGHFPNPYIAVSVSDLCIPRIGLLQQNRQTDPVNVYNVEIGNEAAQFHFWEYIIRTSVEVQCTYINEMSDTVQYTSKTKLAVYRAETYSVLEETKTLQCVSKRGRLTVDITEMETYSVRI
jgi:hypothetical protein